MAEPGLVELFVAFGRELREEGIAIGSGDVLTFTAAAAELDPSDLVDLYWAGRTTLVTRRDQIATYDRVFRRFFLDDLDAKPEAFTAAIAPSAHASAVLEIAATEPGASDDEVDDRPAELGLVASDVDFFRHKSFAACTPDELAAVRRIMARIRLMPPQRRTRRTAPARAGRHHDIRRTVRETMRMHGEPAHLHYRRRRLRLRPIVLILDVSGSMADYSRALLQFAYSTRRAASRVEVFCFGTRLTRITKALERRRPDEALDRAAKLVFDWEGGTRIGDSLHAFVKGWGRRGVSRGAIVVICSDGLDRGHPAMLAGAMEQLARVSHRIVWVNPHKGNATDFTPSTLGMMVAAPHVDVVLSGHDLASLEELADLLPELA